MAKKTVKKKEEVKKGLDVKVKLDKTAKGRVTVTVTLIQDGEVVATDSDWVFVE